jgi:MFS family permease
VRTDGTNWLAAAKGVSTFGGNAAQVAVLVVLSGSRSGAGGLAFYFGLVSATSLLGAPAVGWLADRFAPRRVMVPADLLCAACFVAMAIVPRYAVIVTAGAFSGLLESAFSVSSITWVIRHQRAERQSSVLGRLEAARNIGNVTSPVVAVALLPLIGFSGVVALNALTFVVSCVMVLQIPGLDVGLPTHESRHGPLAGFSVLVRLPTLRVVCGAWVIVAVVAGALVVADPFRAQEFYSLRSSWEHLVGIILSARALGAIVGSAVVGRLGRLTAFKATLLGVLAMGAGLFLMGAAMYSGVLVAGSALFGACDSIALVGRVRLVQQNLHPAVSGRGQAAFDAMVGGTLTLAPTVGAATVGWLGAAHMEVGCAVLLVGAAAILAAGLRSQPGQTKETT